MVAVSCFSLDDSSHGSRSDFRFVLGFFIGSFYTERVDALHTHDPA
jgi:hypothetical protein